jgi:hypothetical protein
MANEPTLGVGYENPTEWVSHLQKMLNMTRSAMALGELAETGHYDSDTKAAVEHFQERARIHVDGIVGDDTWAALWQHVTEVQARQDTSSATSPQPGAAPPPETPPNYLDVNHGRDVVNYYVEDIVKVAHEFAEHVYKLGPPNEVLPKLIDAAHAGVEVTESILAGLDVEILALSQTLFVGGTLLAVLAPLAMWYEAIGANSAGDLHTLRWQVYNPWIDGFLSGLYVRQTRDWGPLFNPVVDRTFTATTNLPDQSKRGVLAFLVSMSSTVNYIPDQANPDLPEAIWNQRGPEHGLTLDGLTIVVTHNDR